MEYKHLQVQRSESANTLVGFIAERLKFSKKKAKALLDQRCVFVNGHRIWMARHELQDGDKVEITTGVKVTPQIDDSMILFQDNDLLIANKPPGILSNGPKSFEKALRIFLSRADPREKYGQLSGESATLTAVHRLDKDTSGCLLFAKNIDVKSRLILLFSQKSICKIYHAVANGKITKTKLTVTKPIEGKTALSSIQVLDANRLATYARIIIETGRTHQIRKHLNHLHHPIIGDKTYATNRHVSPLELDVHRQMLHAYQLIFKHPVNGKSIKCTAPIPDDFRQCLKQYHLK